MGIGTKNVIKIGNDVMAYAFQLLNDMSQCCMNVYIIRPYLLRTTIYFHIFL
jgi:hypothetical protein